MRTKPREAVHSTQSSESYAPSSQNIKQGEHRKVIYSLHNQLASPMEPAESIFLWILLVVSRSMSSTYEPLNSPVWSKYPQ